MSVIAMRVSDVRAHPNADALRIYIMEVPNQIEACFESNQVQIVANLENIYQPGDLVAVALGGSVLKDGTKIKPCKLRGVTSHGMALGIVDAELGEDLSEVYCQSELIDTATNSEDKLTFQKWTSIELLHNVKRNLDILGEAVTITYRAKVKLHGTNAGIQVTTEGKVAAQKRSQIITSKSDNAGFAAWVENNLEYFSALRTSENLAIFGEWCGNNIQKGVAISQLKRKIFAIFAIQIGDDLITPKKLEVRPEKISQMLPKHEDIFVLPYYGAAITLNFGNEEQLKAAVHTINEMVEAVEKSDPWVKATFGIEGIGEGLVMYPDTNSIVERANYTDYMFKAKGAKHQVIKTAKPVSIAPEKVENIAQFVNLFVTEARLQQAVTEACDGQYDLKRMGDFLKWFALDVQKESVAELEAADLTWKEVNQSLMNEAKQWYKAQGII
ncbi:t-RNA-binding domain-containing protein [Stanieria cyanosphaera PCC 7437]|uniref:T-RNA-binding domain-containing protein n=1 Tax=Stanieria cyanosphaera (strain ATCC 29371 / PCC 7437) TaxID=111780 RepID=K9Y0F8_STAC7|nr:RNA ligase family protein [Stanieria cyanosphaera]AFZ37779.1 t-RNA-binding domain-containing protein [Stanieria cyanosphaera PCC 7437]